MTVGTFAALAAVNCGMSGDEGIRVGSDKGGQGGTGEGGQGGTGEGGHDETGEGGQGGTGDDRKCASIEWTGCYWMENTSGNYCWVPADWARTFEDCYAMDSCDGGLGNSGGGCYKWADSSDGERAPW